MMKKSLLFSMLSPLALCIVAGCDTSKNDEPDDVIWDIYPVVVTIDVCDADGNSLLNPADDNNIVGENISVSYHDEDYDIMWNTNYPKATRDYLSSFMGLWHHPVNIWYDDKDVIDPAVEWVISMGELPGDENYDISLPVSYDGKVYEVRVVNRFGWKNNEPDRNTTVYLDGEKCDGQRVTITL